MIALTPYLGDKLIAAFLLLVFVPYMAVASLPPTHRKRCNGCGRRRVLSPLGQTCPASDPTDEGFHDFTILDEGGARVGSASFGARPVHPAPSSSIPSSPEGTGVLGGSGT